MSSIGSGSNVGACPLQHALWCVHSPPLHCPSPPLPLPSPPLPSPPLLCPSTAPCQVPLWEQGEVCLPSHPTLAAPSTLEWRGRSGQGA